jgi:ATP-dependent Lon protease
MSSNNNDSDTMEPNNNDTDNSTVLENDLDNKQNNDKDDSITETEHKSIYSDNKSETFCENNDLDYDSSKLLSIVFGQIIKETLKESHKFNDNNPSSKFFTIPLNFDMKIENYDSDGKIKSEKSFGSHNGIKWFKETDGHDIDKNNQLYVGGSDQLDKVEQEKNYGSGISTSPCDMFSDDTCSGENIKNCQKNVANNENKENKKNEYKFGKNKKNHNSKMDTGNKVDYASSIGDEKFLNTWLESNIGVDGKFNGSSNYTTEALDNASSNGKINILNWWLQAKNNNGLELKYTEKAINFASKFNHVESLEWWAKSNLDLKYNHNAIDYASAGGKLKTLNWWLEAKNKYGWKFDYTSNSIDNAKLHKDKLLELIGWWKKTTDSNPSIKFKYTRDFIDYLEAWDFIEVYKFLQDNNMISKEEKFKSSQKKNSNVLNIFEMFGMPIGIGGSSSYNKSKGEISSKYDLDSLPEDIQKHIREKEEELSNNMLINGKAKEYIDNLVKIPFGKYKIEKIFSFIDDLIKKINQINLSSSNDVIQKFKLTNESDLIDFFSKIKFYHDNTYNKYFILYEKFIQIRKKYMGYVDKILDETVYGHNSTKKHIKCIISQWLSGGFKSGVVIGIQGPPGVGKTTIIKGALSKCLIDFINYNLESEPEPYLEELNLTLETSSEKLNARPFCFMSLGGTTNGSTLSGHNITYHGATSGDIVKHLKEAKIMNPILYFDELDKISNTEHGHEISSVLTHITDPVQNAHFTDRYFSEVKIDLSKCIIVFSYNDTSKIDRILLDRIQEIRLNPIKSNEKLVICKKFIIPEICSQLGYNPSEIEISDDKLSMIINDYTLEAGVRKLKEKLFEILRMNHLELIQNPPTNVISTNKIISSEFISDTFGDYPKISHKKISKTNGIGCINGMFASVSGMGGITIIQAKQIYSKENLAISITGSVEKVMEESIRVARTVAWNYLERDEQDTIIKNWDSRGIHIHFPDGATPKDGPSAGTAITCAIYSLLTSKPIKNNVAITGEIDLDGNVTQIGGLDAKLNGAKRAGVKIALVPKENDRELEIVKKNNPDLIDNTFKVFKISHVSNAFKYIF